jgi:hypothetical protein
MTKNRLAGAARRRPRPAAAKETTMFRTSKRSLPILLAALAVLSCRVAASAAEAVPWATGFGNLDLGREYEHLLRDQSNYLGGKTDVFTSFYIKRGSIAEAEAALPQKQALWRQLTAAKIRIARSSR